MKNLITLAFIAVAIIASSSKMGKSKDDGSDGRTKEYSSISKYFFPIFATVTLAFNAMTINSIEPSSLDKGTFESPKEDPKEFEYSYKAEIIDTPETQYINPWDSSLNYNFVKDDKSQDEDEVIVLDQPEEMEEIERDKNNDDFIKQVKEDSILFKEEMSKFSDIDLENVDTMLNTFIKSCNDHDPFTILKESVNEIPEYTIEKSKADLEFTRLEFKKIGDLNRDICKRFCRITLANCISFSSPKYTFIVVKYLIINNELHKYS